MNLVTQVISYLRFDFGRRGGNITEAAICQQSVDDSATCTHCGLLEEELDDLVAVAGISAIEKLFGSGAININQKRLSLKRLSTIDDRGEPAAEATVEEVSRHSDPESFINVNTIMGHNR